MMISYYRPPFISPRASADEYRMTIAKDAALERRFQPVSIDEPSVESTISILRGLKSRYETHHGVEISDSALVTGTARFTHTHNS